MSSYKFSQQIKKLEEEGAKLLAATHNLGDSLLGPEGYSKKNGSGNKSALDLSALTDITAEQKTISDLRFQLDTQCKETERLHREMFNTSGSAKPPESALSSTLANLDIPLARTPASLNTSKSADFQTGLSERQLKDARSEVTELRARLKETLSISEQQKAHFRTTIEDLRIQLQSAVSSRDSLLSKSKREMEEKHQLLIRLQETVDQLEKANKLQEETLLEMNDKLENLRKDKYIIDTAVVQIRDVLLEREKKRGRVFYENEPISKQSISMLVHSVERAFHDVDFDVHNRQDRIDQLLLEMDDLKLRQERKEDQVILEYERKMSSQREDFGLQMSTLQEQVNGSKERTALLIEQNMSLEKQLDQQVRTREETIADLEGKLKLLVHDQQIDRTTWTDKKVALEHALEETQKELALARGDKDEAVRRAAQVESRFTDMQSTIDKLREELLAEQEKVRTAVEKATTAHSGEERMQLQLKHKDHVLADLEQKFKVVKHEADTHIQTAIHSMEKEGKAYIEREMSSLKTQLQAMTDKCHAQQLELELTKSEHNHLKEKFTDTKASLDKTAGQLELSNTKQQSLTAMVTEKMTEVERITKEKEHVQKLLEEQNNEILTLKSLREKLTIQLEEREKNFLQLQTQHERIADMVQSSSQHSGQFKEERDTLQQKFNEKIIETEELRKMRDTISKKLRLREKRIQDLEEENRTLAAELGERKVEFGALEKEKEKIFAELKESRYEVARLEENRQATQQKLHHSETALEKERSKLSRRLKSSEHDLKLVKRALKSKEHVDNKAVRVAGDMQKEVTAKRSQVDSLQTRIRWLEDCLEAALKDKKCLEEEKEGLLETLERKRQRSEKMAHDFRNNVNKADESKHRVAKLEGALEKAAIKNAALETQLEQHEQELTRLKIKHQLELKEVQRTGKIKTNHSSQNKPTEKPSQATPVQTNTATHFTSTLPGTQTALTPQSVTTSSTHYGTPPSATLNGHHVGTSRGVYTAELEDRPVRDTEKQDHQSREGEFTRELRDLMREMRSVLGKEGHHKSQPLSDSVVFSDSELAPRRLTRRGSGRMRKGDRKRNSQPRHLAAQSQRSVSPVSDLLLTFDEIQSDSCLLSNDSMDESTSDFTQYLESDEGARRTAQIGPAAQDVCKRLERKIESLSKMGSHLHSEHQEMARVMQDQDRKLQKVKSQMR